MKKICKWFSFHRNAVFAVFALTLALCACNFCYCAQSETAFALDEQKYIPIGATAASVRTSAAVSTVAFYAANDRLICYLPETYYLKFGSESETAYFVRYGEDELYGKVLKSQITATPKTVDGIDVHGAYPTLAVSLTQTANFLPLVSLLDGTLGTARNVTQAEAQNLVYLGELNRDSVACLFVKFGAEYGYVAKNDTNFTALPSHALAVFDETPDGTLEPAATANTASNPTAKLLLSIGIAIPALFIVWLLFKPRKANTDYDSTYGKRGSSKKRGDNYRGYDRGYDDNPRGYDRRYDDGLRAEDRGTRARDGYSRDYDRSDLRDYDNRGYGRGYDRSEREFDRDYDRDYDGRNGYGRGYDDTRRR